VLKGETPEKTAKRRAKTWKWATSGENGQASLNVTGKRMLSHVTVETGKIAKRWAKTWKEADVGENGQASLNKTQTRKLPRVTVETPKKG
jgi:hypothetical protein